MPDSRHDGRQRNRVGVIGGGVVGSSIAYHLSRRGAEVILFEKSGPAAGVTETSFAWINASYAKKPFHYHLLNRLGMKGWLDLDKDLGDELGLQWTGNLVWHSEPNQAEELKRQVVLHQAWGYPTYLIESDEISNFEKQIVTGPVVVAAYTESEGIIDPAYTTGVILKKAREHGLRLECPNEVLELDIRSGRLHGVRTTRGDFEIDLLVIAAGNGTPHLAAMAGLDVPLIESPGVLAHTKPTAQLIHNVIHAPGATIKQAQDGRIVTGPGFGGHPGTDQSRELGEQFLDRAAIFLPAIKEAELDRVTLGWRTLPADGHPIVGFHDRAPDVYLAVMHSGVTLAPIIGQLAGLEILDKVRVELLDPYCLSRFDTKGNISD